MINGGLILARHRLGDSSALWFVRLALVLTALLTFALAVDLGQGGVLFVFWRRTLLVFAVAGLSLALLVAASILGSRNMSTRMEDFLHVLKFPVFVRYLGLPGFLLTGVLLFFLYLGPFHAAFESLPARFLILHLASLLGAFFLSARQAAPRWLFNFLFGLIVFSFIYQVMASLPALSLTPFSRGWSEGTRYYHASLFLSERYYDLSLPPFYQDLSRYVLEVIPLLLPHPSLWLERFWETLLEFLLPALTVGFLLRRLSLPRVSHRAFWLALFLWGTLFLLQGPVYFYLLFAAIPLLAFFRPDGILPSVLALLVASIWAGISRVNWLPIPAMLAVALYLLERPIGKLSLIRYLLPPAVYTVLGLVTAYVARQWYLGFAQASPEMFNIAFQSPMLWYRLFPSSLNAWGILPSGLVMILPLALFLLAHLRGRGAGWHPIRIIGLGLILFVLLAGGFLVSAKIGGGNNLHNLDGFLTLALTVGFYLLFDRFMPDIAPPSLPQSISCLTVTLLVLGVTVFTVSQAYPALPSMDRHEASLTSLQQLVDEAVADGGQVLFITQRHLLTFDLITGVPLVPEYDNIDLMEFAMTNYRPSIDKFHADISAHKYALIIAPIPPGQLQTREDAFGEENNAWLKRVSIPMLREYDVLATFPEGDFVVLVPSQ